MKAPVNIRTGSFLAYLAAALDSDDPNRVTDALLMVSRTLRRRQSLGRAERTPSVRADDGSYLLVAMLDLARIGRLHLADAEADEIRELRDVLTRALDGRGK